VNPEKRPLLSKVPKKKTRISLICLKSKSFLDILGYIQCEITYYSINLFAKLIKLYLIKLIT